MTTPKSGSPGLPRLTRPVVLTVALIPVLLIVLAPVDPFQQWTRARTQAEAESFQILASAGTAAERDEAVGHLGIVLTMRDGSWIAIRYRDTHVGTIWSSSVARDSGGNWYVSEVHFCGRFRMYRLAKEQGKDLAYSREFEAIERAATLTEARPQLLALGFRPVPPPR